MELQVVGKVLSNEYPSKWVLIAICSSKDKAIDACRSKDYFIGLVVLDRILSDVLEDWVGVEYPFNEGFKR